MTIPQEEYWSLIKTRKFLFSLLDPKQTPRVPRKIRQEAHRHLRHYPYDFVIKDIWDQRIKKWEEDLSNHG